MKSRAQRMMETVLREEEPVSNVGLMGNPPGPGQGQAPFAGAAPGGDLPQPSQSNPNAPDLKQLVSDFAGQPDGMAGLIDQQASMMDRYMDEDDQEVYTPESPEDKEAVMAAKNSMMEAMGHINKVQYYTK